MGKLLAYSQISLTVVSDLSPSPTPPENPQYGDIWVDSSVDPPAIRQWDGEKWIYVNNGADISYSLEQEWITQNYTDGGSIAISSLSGNTFLHKDRKYIKKADGTVEKQEFAESPDHYAYLCSAFDSSNIFGNTQMEPGYWPYEEVEEQADDYSNWTKTSTKIDVIPNAYYRLIFFGEATEAVVLFYSESPDGGETEYSGEYQFVSKENRLFQVSSTGTQVYINFNHSANHVRLEAAEFALSATGKNLISSSSFLSNDGATIAEDSGSSSVFQISSQTGGTCHISQVISLKRNAQHVLRGYMINLEDNPFTAILRIYPLKKDGTRFPLYDESGLDTGTYYKVAEIFLSDVPQSEWTYTPEAGSATSYGGVLVGSDVFNKKFEGNFYSDEEFALYSVEIEFTYTNSLSTKLANFQIEIGANPTAFSAFERSVDTIPIAFHLSSFSRLMGSEEEEETENQSGTANRDTMDLSNAVFAFNTADIFFNGTENWIRETDRTNTFEFSTELTVYESAASDDCVNLQNTCFCSILPRIETTADEEGFFVVNQDIGESGSEVRKSYLHVLLNKTRLTGEDPLDSWKTLLQSFYTNSEPVLFLYLLQHQNSQNIENITIERTESLTSSEGGLTNVHSDTHTMAILYLTFYSYVYSQIVQSQLQITKTDSQIQQLITNTTITTENGDISIKEAYSMLEQNVNNFVLEFGTIADDLNSQNQQNRDAITRIEAGLNGLSISIRNSPGDNMIPNSAGFYAFGDTISTSGAPSVRVIQSDADAQTTTSGAYWQLSRTTAISEGEELTPVTVTWNQRIRLVPETEYALNFKYQFIKADIQTKKDFPKISFSVFPDLTGEVDDTETGEVLFGPFEKDEDGRIIPNYTESPDPDSPDPENPDMIRTYTGYNQIGENAELEDNPYPSGAVQCLTETGNQWVDFQKEINYYEGNTTPLISFISPSFGDDLNLQVTFTLNGYGTFRISDFVLVQGAYVDVWRQYPNETKTSIVSISDEGIRIEKNYDPESSDEDQNFRGLYTNKGVSYTKIIRDSDGNEINSKLVAQFDINGAKMGTTEVQGPLTVGDAELSYPALKIVPNPTRNSVMFVVLVKKD